MLSHSALVPRSSLPDVTLFLPDHRRATGEILWCAPGTSTYIVATLRSFYGDAGMIMGLLQSSFGIIESMIDLRGDGPVETGHFTCNNFAPGIYLQLAVQNANNHQITYGVLKASIDALHDYMWEFGYGLVTAMTIYDGPNEVGTGTLRVVYER